MDDVQAELTRLQAEQESRVDLSGYLQEGDEQEGEGEQPATEE